MKMQTSGDQRREIAKLYPPSIASEAKQSIPPLAAPWIASLRSQTGRERWPRPFHSSEKPAERAVSKG
jgi:hypothetical protein